MKLGDSSSVSWPLYLWTIRMAKLPDFRVKIPESFLELLPVVDALDPFLVVVNADYMKEIPVSPVQTRFLFFINLIQGLYLLFSRDVLEKL